MAPNGPAAARFAEPGWGMLHTPEFSVWPPPSRQPRGCDRQAVPTVPRGPLAALLRVGRALLGRSPWNKEAALPPVQTPWPHSFLDSPAKLRLDADWELVRLRDGCLCYL